jgi:threonine/homoserine/homoserine lactone efflux protein
MQFVEAVGFQWINPKAWSMAVAATSQFILPSAPYTTAIVVTVMFLTLGFGSAATWTYAGQAIARWLTTAKRLRIFNLIMAGLIVLSIVEILRH